MGTQLKSTDILGELEKDEKPEKKTKPARRASPAPKQDMTIAELKQTAEAAANGKPSPYQSSLRAKLRDKTQFNFAEIPTFIVDEFEALRAKAGMNKREYLYHLLRKEGADIPPYEEMDGRKL